MMTKISAGRTMKLRFSWITDPPYAMSRFATSIRGGAARSGGTREDEAITGSEAEADHVEDDAQEPVRHDDEDDRRHHRRGGGQSDRRGAPPGLHAAEAAGEGDQHAEDRCPDEAH